MIGMVNAIGAGQAARDLNGARPTARPIKGAEVGEPPMWVRPRDPNPSDTESVRAVRPAEDNDTSAPQAKPDGDTPRVADRTAADRPPAPPASRPQANTVGQALDMVA